MKSHWKATVGPETDAFLLQAPSAARAKLLAEAVDIIEQCPAPSNDASSCTGLALGYVQSGKTMSFTTVATLARDNNYPIVIVLCGTSKPLYTQSVKRLEGDLRLRTRKDRKWAFIQNPASSSRQTFENFLADWRDPTRPPYSRVTLLVPVLKHASRIKALALLCKSIGIAETVLIIDDEADQAGLNTKVNDADISSTNAAIQQLKAAIPRHAYIEYTATPQALLLISIIDQLSPKFAKLLTPGDDYVGGKTYFIDRPELIRTIPPSELPLPANNLAAPPRTFLEALRCFFVGVAVGNILDRAEGNRSMMVHPSRLKDVHGDYAKWSHAVMREWKSVLALETTDTERIGLLKEFESAYDDLAQTQPVLPPWQSVSSTMSLALSQAEIIELNTTSGKMPEVDWSLRYANIVVGGQAIDRGFTVEGLTVTYMPRLLGTGNADTFQQRARFFGYKRQYLGLCRVYLEVDVRNAYKSYVEHEEDVRARLIDYSDKDLSTWKRSFFLDPAFEPTRRNVISDPVVRGQVDDAWFVPKRPYVDQAAVEENNATTLEFTRCLPGPLTSLDGQTAYLAQPIAAIRNYLVGLRFTDPADGQKLASYLLTLSSLAESQPNTLVDIILVRNENLSTRTLDLAGAIEQLFEGRRPKSGPPKYVGDRNVCRANVITLQIHRNRLLARDKSVVCEEIYVPALKLAGPGLPGVIEQPGNVQPSGGSIA